MSPSQTDRWFALLLRSCAALAATIVLLIVAFLITESLPALRRISAFRFLTDASWHPNTDPAAGTFNLTPMLAGTLLATAGAMLIATPLGILSAVFCNFYAPKRAAAAYRHLLALLAGVPSVVYGLWGLIVLVPLIRLLQPPGPSLLAGTLILALMILPTIALTADTALAAVPRTYHAAAHALAFSHATTIRAVALPAARSGIAAGLILATGRALGETMAVLMVCGNIVQVPTSLFDPVRTLTANIALEMAYAVDTHRSVLFVTGLALMAIVTALAAAPHLVQRRTAHA